MATIDLLGPNDILHRDERGKFFVTQVSADCVTTIPVAFNDVPDYFRWLDRNADRLCDDPEDFRRLVRLMAEEVAK